MSLDLRMETPSSHRQAEQITDHIGLEKAKFRN
jgi:hypothetical protein